MGQQDEKTHLVGANNNVKPSTGIPTPIPTFATPYPTSNLPPQQQQPVGLMYQPIPLPTGVTQYGTATYDARRMPCTLPNEIAHIFTPTEYYSIKESINCCITTIQKRVFILAIIWIILESCSFVPLWLNGRNTDNSMYYIIALVLLVFFAIVYIVLMVSQKIKIRLNTVIQLNSQFKSKNCQFSFVSIGKRTGGLLCIKYPLQPQQPLIYPQSFPLVSPQFQPQPYPSYQQQPQQYIPANYVIPQVTVPTVIDP